MRVVYGAGAIAAVSVMTVGLVQPTWGAQDSVAAPNDVASRPMTTPRDHAPSTQTQPDVVVEHVIRYIHLKPGQKAPPGATVITPDAPTPRVIVVRNRPAKPGPSVQQANPPTLSRPPAVAQPPRTTTHQSGRPR